MEATSGDGAASTASTAEVAPTAGSGRRELVALLGVQALAGLVAGLAWWVLAHDPPRWLAGEPWLTNGSVDAARDGSLAVLELVLGAAAGLRVLRRPGPRPLLTLLVGIGGALLASGLAVAVAAVLPVGVDSAHVVPRAWGVALLWPTALAGVVFVRTLAQSLVAWVRG
ncbi:hypothetical protein [Kineococcus glutinatus]|uniref:hypothetical protein n=1 Tax=Kineococcus glutinatus TaxID=1070872 RepID=UPI0031EFFE67